MIEETSNRFYSADDEHGLISVFVSTPTIHPYDSSKIITERPEEQLVIRCDYMDIEEEETIAFAKADVPRLVALLQSFMNVERKVDNES